MYFEVIKLRSNMKQWNLKDLCLETLKTVMNELKRPAQAVHKWETSQKKVVCI